MTFFMESEECTLIITVFALKEGQWVWSDGTPYDYTSWCSTEPNNMNTENCGEINWTCKNAVWFLLSMIIDNPIISYQAKQK